MQEAPFAIVVLGEDAYFSGIIWLTMYICGAGVAAGMAVLLGLFAYHFLRATFRFGQEAFAASWFIGLAAIFSGAAYIAAGPFGLSAGILFLATYALGRWRARSSAPFTD